MELMGDWNRGVMQTLAGTRKPCAPFLGWFPFPAIAGAAG